VLCEEVVLAQIEELDSSVAVHCLLPAGLHRVLDEAFLLLVTRPRWAVAVELPDTSFLGQFRA
jgi:hypothetical protein